MIVIDTGNDADSGKRTWTPGQALQHSELTRVGIKKAEQGAFLAVKYKMLSARRTTCHIEALLLGCQKIPRI